MTRVKGVVQRVHQKQLVCQFGPQKGEWIHLYSLLVDGTWYRHGSNKPACAQGDEIEFEAREGKRAPSIQWESLEILSTPEQRHAAALPETKQRLEASAAERRAAAAAPDRRALFTRRDNPYLGAQQ